MRPRPGAASHRSFRSRGFEGESDLVEMQRLLMQARSRTDDWRYAHVGELLFSYFMVVCHLDPREHVRLWHDPAGGLVGYAILGEDPSLDWQVAPEHEWTGIEAEVLAWAASRLSELRDQDADTWGGSLVSGSRQDNPSRIAFLERHGFRFRGDFAEVNMLRYLSEPIPEAAVPDGFHVRAVDDGIDPVRRAAAQREVWLPWSVGNVGGDDYRVFMQMPGYHPELDLVAQAPDGLVAAYVNGWIDPVNRVGDFGPVGALPAYRRRGLTRAVLVQCLRRMRALGMERVCVSTTLSNTPAWRLYESIGFKVVNRYLDYVQTEAPDQPATT